MCYTVLRCIGDIFAQKKAGDLFVPKIANLPIVESKILIQYNWNHLCLPFGKSDQFPAFFKLIFPTHHQKIALETILLNQRQRQGLRQRLRRVSKASASRQHGRRRC